MTDTRHTDCASQTLPKAVGHTIYVFTQCSVPRPLPYLSEGIDAPTKYLERDYWERQGDVFHEVCVWGEGRSGGEGRGQGSSFEIAQI